jgi:phosphatidylglycerol:prolipoprotein diacylglycerol transferase
MLPLLRVFGLTIQTPLLAILVGYMLSLFLTSRIGADHGLDGNALSDAGFYGLIAGVIGARVGYVLQNLQAYMREPLSALMPSTTALLSVAGWVTGVAFAVFYLWRKRMLRWPLLDVLAPGAALFLAGMAAGALLSGDSFGTAAQLPWSIYLWDAWRHPVQGYEFIALLAILALLYVSLQRRLPEGTTVLLLVGLYAFTRVVIDAYRAEEVMLVGFRVTQLVGVVASAASFLAISVLKQDCKEKEMISSATPTSK